MFSSDFWPTPRAVARGMIQEISKDAKYFLEPNAGMGHLADVIKRPYTWEEAEAEYDAIFGDDKKHDRKRLNDDEERRYYRVKSLADPDYGRHVEIDVIEPDPNFCHVLSSKGYAIVGFDWLNYSGVSYYDSIIMNPPFSNGDEHLLKAWDFLFKGEIVCLLNKETINNPYTESRQRLVKIIMDHGRVKQLGKCFSTAERPTDVEVVQVYLKKDPPDDSADLWASEVTNENNPECENHKEPDFVAIRDNLENLVRWYEMANKHFIKGFEEIRKGCLYMRQYKLDSAYEDSRNRSKAYDAICGEAMSSSHGARADFLRKHRKDAWYTVFKQFQFHKWLDSKQQERMMRDVARDMHLPFTVENIKATLENVFLSRKKLFDESVANVFDELTSAFAGNTKHSGGGGDYSGWKTNDSYKVNERLVFPYGCEGDGRGFRTRYGDTSRLYADLDRILCVLDGKPFEKCFTIGHAIDKHAQGSGELVYSDYFEIRCYKKGTVHLKWKRKDLLEAFNKTAANGKRWIGENTQAKYKPREKKTSWECDHKGHEFVNGECSRCQEPEAGEWDHVACPLCRTVAEYTGRVECPLHPSIEQRIEAPEETAPAELLALPAPVGDINQGELFA